MLTEEYGFGAGFVKNSPKNYTQYTQCISSEKQTNKTKHYFRFKGTMNEAVSLTYFGTDWMRKF